MQKQVALEQRAARLVSLGYNMEPPAPGTLPWMDRVVIVDGIAFVSGHTAGKGKVPSQCPLDEAKKAAAAAMANLLRSLRAELGSLDKVERVIRVGGYVNIDLDFTDPSSVIHGASELLAEVFGAAGNHCRTALGVAQLPAGTAVEVDAVFKVKA